MPDETKPDATPTPAPPAAEAAKPVAEEAKPAAAAPAAPAAPKPAAPAKAPVPTPQPWDSDIAKRMKERFGDAILEATSYLGDNFLVVEAARIEEICFSLRDDEKFNMLTDLTPPIIPRRTSASKSSTSFTPSASTSGCA